MCDAEERHEIESSGGKLAGKVALITGAGSGIGRAMSQLFAQEGAEIVAADLDWAAAEETAGLLAPGEALAVAVDVAESASVQQMVAAALERFGRINVLCNNAGIGSTKDVIETEPEEWDRVFAVNARGTFVCSKYVLPHMIARGAG